MGSGKKSENKRQKTVEYGLFFLMLALFLAAAAAVLRLTAFGAVNTAVNLYLSLITLLFSLLLYFFCISSFTWDAREKRRFTTMVIVFFFTGLPALILGGIEGKPDHQKLIMPLYTLLYLLSSLYWLSFWAFQKGKYQHRFGEKVCAYVNFSFFGVYVLVTLINHFTGFCFSVGEDGGFVIRSYLLFYLTALWFVIYFIIAVTADCALKTKLTLVSYSVFPLLSWLVFLLFPHSAFYLSIFTNFAMLLYLVPLYLMFFNIYLEQGQLFLQRERELELSRANAMMLKISPHFIANTMSSIVALCYPDAPEAGDLAAKFAHYLRDNYADMSEDAMLPFSKELEHIRNYLAIEEVRFPGLRVEYEIGEDAFLLPTLTVQPLVENAVRHGVSKRPDASGTVKIQSVQEEDCHVIRIIDDGVGFDTSERREGRHIGIPNARTRLKMLCGGTLTVTSQPGHGTVCEIRIPKGG